MVERHDPPVDGDERSMLLAFLDYQRATVRWKCSGLDPDQLAQRVGASELTLGMLLLHLSIVEDTWFAHRFAGGPPTEERADLDPSTDHRAELGEARALGAEELLARYDAACQRSRAVAAAAPSTGSLSVLPDPHTGVRFPLRWGLLHLIEETARHNGHIDLLRESIDGLTGE